MSVSPRCFQNIIGLSRKECECVDTMTEEAMTSESGLYLDELDGLPIRLIDAVKDCGDGGLIPMGLLAISEAVEQTKEALMACLGDNTDPRRRSGSTTIGDEKKAAGDGPKLTDTWHGLTVQMAHVKGGISKLTHIGVAMKHSGTFTLYIYDREGLLDSYVVNAVANKVTWNELPTPLELSMDEFQMGDQRYWFVFQPSTFTFDSAPTDGILRAMNSRIDCQCGGGFTPSFNLALPQYLSSNSKGGTLWAEWSMASGTHGADLDNREEWTTGSNGLNPTDGLLLRFAFDCDETTSFCADPPNYQTDGIQKVLAHAVRFKAAANLITRILSSTKINQYTMTGGEILQQNRGRFESEWNKRIVNHVCPKLAGEDVNRYGDCLKCKDHTGMRRSLIRN